MARKLHLVLLLAGALAMVSLMYCAAEGDQTLAAEVGHRMLLQAKPEKENGKEVLDPKGVTVGAPKAGESHAKCYDRAGCDICSAWKRKGYCGPYTYKHYSVPNFWCQQTCCTCNTCVDLYPKACYEWACKGYCAPKWSYNGYSIYKVVCPKTCGYCH